MKKAYLATNNYYEEDPRIVFAENAQGAKKQAYGNDGFEEYLEIRVSRMPDADKFASEGHAQLEFDTIEHQRFFREHGWWYGDPKTCAECGLHEYEDIEESHLDADGICGECRAKEAVNA